MISDSICQGVRILVVEDEPFQRRLLREVLRNVGFQKVEEAESGVTAISALQDSGLDLVLSDIDMPGLNGLELLRRIRVGQIEARRDLPFLILTSHSNTEVLGAAIALDVNGFIVKPFRTRMIVEKITRVFNQQMILRSSTEYDSVETDLVSLGRRKQNVNGDLQSTAAHDGLKGRVEIPLAELRSGMRLAKSVVAKVDDTIIVAAETTLTDVLIKLLSDLKELLPSERVTVHVSV